MLWTAALLAAASTASAGHAADHDNTCVGDSSSERTTQGGGNYTHDIYERCLLSLEGGTKVCAGVENEGHYRSGRQGSASSTHEDAAFCSFRANSPFAFAPPGVLA